MASWVAGYIDRMPSGAKLTVELTARMEAVGLGAGRGRSLAYHLAMLAQEAGALLVLLRDLQAAHAAGNGARAVGETRVPIRRHARAAARHGRGLPPGPVEPVREDGRTAAEALGDWLGPMGGGSPQAAAEDVREVAQGCALLLRRLDRALADEPSRDVMAGALAGILRDWGPRGSVYERLFGGRGGPGLYRRLAHAGGEPLEGDGDDGESGD